MELYAAKPLVAVDIRI